ncbi:MAG: phosphate ABC transporter permease PstA [Candidatus Saccharimonadales bacterium]
MSILAQTSLSRRRKDKLIQVALLFGIVLALTPLALVLAFIIIRGLPAISLHFFTSDPSGAFLGDQGGIKSAILGSLEIVGLATLIAVPCGITLAIYLTEVGVQSKLAAMMHHFIDVLTGVPSIVFGLFIYTLLVVSGVTGGFAAWKGSVALALLMFPIVARAAEVTLNTVPNSLREAALALGASRWRMITQVVLPTALPGLLTATLLSVARASGETAPLLFTVLGAQVTSFSLNSQMNSLPLQIFNDVRQPSPELVTRAWGAALTLISLVLIINIVARIVQQRSRL